MVYMNIIISNLGKDKPRIHFIYMNVKFTYSEWWWTDSTIPFTSVILYILKHRVRMNISDVKM